MTVHRSRAAAALLLAVLAACSSSGGDATPSSSSTGDPSAPAGTLVTIAGFRFQPDRIEVTAGTTVRWENTDQILHTVTQGTPDEPGGAVLDGTLAAAGTSYEATPTEPGEYPYFCSRHTSMTGTLVVT